MAGTAAQSADVDDLFSLSLRPGGTTSLFAAFGKGAGVGIKPRNQPIGESAPSQRKKDPNGKILKYSKDFLLAFAEKYTAIPPPLEHSKLEIFTREETNKDTSTVESNEDNRDWRARDTGAAGGDAAGKTGNAKQSGNNDRWTQKEQERVVEMKSDDPALKIQKAADLGRTAWMPNQVSAIGEASNLKKIKGILNKLTPEKFERLLVQMVELVVSAEVLHGSITYIFENAVAQPTFVQMYAELCEQLSKALPDFAPPEGETKPQTFRRILLNTCQEEYEGATSARDQLDSIEDAQERMIEERKVKQRMLGNVRLISQLHKIKVVNEKIILVCLRELIGDDAKVIPPEDDIEALCEIITIVGGTLAASPQAHTRNFLEGYLTRLEKLSKSKSLSSRTRFMIIDVLDMRHNNWVPRRETQTAKKLSEVHSQAQAELGVVVPGIQVQTNLPMLNLPGTKSSAQMAAESEMFPSFRGSESEWNTVGKGGKKNTADLAGMQVQSAFVGDYVPVPTRSATPASATSSAPAVKLTPEKMEEKTKSMFKEYTSIFDVNEVALCIQELNAPEFMPKLVELGFSVMFDCIKEKEQVGLIDLLIKLAKEGTISKEHLCEGLKTQMDVLEDLRMDFPVAPKLLGNFLASAIVEGILGMDALRDGCNANEDTSGESKRALAEECLKAIAAKGGDMRKLATESGVKGSEFLAADPELDPPDMPSVDKWLSQNGFDLPL